jgi:DNA-binding NarL/FixJ family response regulator
MYGHLQEKTLVRAAQIRKPRIVVADDNLAYLDEVCSLLESRFEVVAKVANGCECVDAIQRHSAPIAVTDISMPKMNGIEATRQITKNWPSVKVVVLSANDDPAFVEAALEAGASAYVVKLSAFDDLIPAIEEVLAGRSYYSVLR